MNGKIQLIYILFFGLAQVVVALAALANLVLLLFHRREIRERLVRVGLYGLAWLLIFLVGAYLFGPSRENLKVKAYYIPSPAMLDTLHVQDRILVDKTAYRDHQPGRGDIILFAPPPWLTRKPGEVWIKRVIGVPGDRISIHDNHLFLNGVRKEEPYVTLLDPHSDKPGQTPIRTGRYDYSFPDPEWMSLKPGQAAYVNPAPDMSLEEAINERRYLIHVTRDRAPRKGGDYLFFVRHDPAEGLEMIVPPGQLFVLGDNRNDSEDSHFWGCLTKERVTGQAFYLFWPLSHLRPLNK